jgi:hypothetical protein
MSTRKRGLTLSEILRLKTTHSGTVRSWLHLSLQSNSRI